MNLAQLDECSDGRIEFDDKGELFNVISNAAI